MKKIKLFVLLRLLFQNLLVLLTNKNLFKTLFSIKTISSYILQIIGYLIIGMIPALSLLWPVSLDGGGGSRITMNWPRFWNILPYMSVGLIAIGMILIKGKEEKHISIFFFFLAVIILIPLDMYLNGLKAILTYAKFGFVFGAAFSALFFSVITFQYNSTGVQNISDNFNKENFIGAFFLCIFTSLIGVLGHSIINFLRLFL